MKRCPVCNRIYSEDDLNFCLDDGNVLQHHNGEEPTRSLRDNMPPTIVLDPPRVTNPIGWDAGHNIQPFQSQQNVYQQPVYQPYQMTASPNQTLAVMSLGFGVSSLVIGWCCYIGFLLGPAGIIMGIVSLIQIKNQPQSYGGKAFAWIGIGAGSAFLVLYILLIVLWGVFTIIQP
jgi:hypothetical protein